MKLIMMAFRYSDMEQFLRIMGPFSANSSSHTFLLEFLQFVVGKVVHSTGFVYM